MTVHDSPSLKGTSPQLRSSQRQSRAMEIWEDLDSWQRDIKQKDLQLLKKKPLSAQKLDPPRPTAEIVLSDEVLPKDTSTMGLKPDNATSGKTTERIASSDYGAWEKFDVDKAVQDLDNPPEQLIKGPPTVIKGTPKKSLTPTKVPEMKAKSSTPAQKKEEIKDKGKGTPRTEQALAEKNKGNAFFQKRQYPRSIEHYTRGMELDPSNSVFPINRAMAYLKLNNFNAAENDCTLGLILQPDNVKALWRRGIARRELGRVDEAREDLELALALDPENKSVLEELAKLPEPVKESDAEALATMEVAPPQSSPLPVATMAPASSAPSIPRKRLVIEEIDDEDEETIVIPSKDAQKSKIAHLAQELPVAAPIINETSPQIAKVVEPVPNPVLSAASTITDTAVLTPPKTIYEFQRDWKMYKTRGDAALYAYMKCIPPAVYSTLFRSSLEAEHVEKMLSILRDYYLPNEPKKATLEVLVALSKVQRFDILVMFMNNENKEALQTIFAHLLQPADGHEELPPQEEIMKLASAYKTMI